MSDNRPQATLCSPLRGHPMTALSVIIPTIGRRSLSDTLESLAPQMQENDRVMVVVDDLARYDFCSEAVNFAREASDPGVAWRCLPNHGQGGHYGHPARNAALDLLCELEERPEWCWSIDDDDIATFGAVDMIRSAIDSREGAWYVFKMRGGVGSHFPNVTVPALGPQLLRGNVGTPMLVWPLGRSRFGVNGEWDGMPAGYFGDFEMSHWLLLEFGEPAWREETVAEIRPVAVAV